MIQTNDFKNIKDERCSQVSRRVEEDPIGSSPTYATYLFVEVPLPWESNVEETQHLPTALLEVLRRVTAEPGSSFRFQAFYSETNQSPERHVRVFYFSRPAFPCASFDKVEYVVPAEVVGALAEALIMGQGRLSEFDPFLQPSSDIREIFICTHGSRDLCCSENGYPLYEYLQGYVTEKVRTAKSDTQAKATGEVRAWRVSHLGGHRHAPTLVEFPSGRYWAKMTPEALDQLIERKGNFANLARHYRGWAMLETMEQVAERELFIRHGWAWTDFHKKATRNGIDPDQRKSDSERNGRDNDSTIVRIDYTSSDRAISGTYEAEVYVSGKVITGGCGSEASEVKQFAIRVHSVSR